MIWQSSWIQFYATTRNACEGLLRHGRLGVGYALSLSFRQARCLSYVTVRRSRLCGLQSFEALETVVGLDEGEQTVEKEGIYDGLEIDLVTHDAEKFFTLMLKRNGYVLEQIFSPLVVFAGADHEELQSIAANCITKHHAHHYPGFAATQWKLFSKESPPRVKPLLYVFRVLLSTSRELFWPISRWALAEWHLLWPLERT
ncbi:putative nucleotidyltransferase [Allorhodopirellula solitaria]|uniref:Putative nucleotidyltransferase n=1 Tax=Allorhodopirellula solitaria TaxID=2527987 RepID=A0A5C5XYY0_9BACT|nr:putative nucleotidyltransferase [Allorhodopirellula solitaria]